MQRCVLAVKHWYQIVERLLQSRFWAPLGRKGSCFPCGQAPRGRVTCFDSARGALLRRIAYEAGMYTVRRLSGCLSDLRPLPPEEYSPKGKRLLMEPLDGWGVGETPLPWKTIRRLSRLCAGCGRCARRCARKLSTSELLADLRSQHPHWTQFVWDIWIRRVGPLWPLAGRIASLPFLPGGSSLETARALLPQEPAAPWVRIKPAVQVGGGDACGCVRRMYGAQRPPRLDCAG